MYNDDDYLQLSGLQHYLFCPRQWALIHIENQWQENLRTVDGELMHKNVHKEGSVEKRGAKLTAVMDMEKDSLRIYNLGNHYTEKITHYGTKPGYDPSGPLIV